VLCLQDEIADRVIAMLEGAMDELALGDPGRLATDVGPVIDEAARKMLFDYVEKMRGRGFRVRQVPGHVSLLDTAQRGTYLPPTLVEIKRIEDLEREVFGPVLHVLRFRRDGLDALVDGINALEYGLTLGVHSRVDETIDRIVERARVGNIYVNRNIIGAVVGVQPFGGEGLSGTGPKAGGPLYVYRMLASAPPDAVIEELRAVDEPGLRASLKSWHPALAPFEALRAWAKASAPHLAGLCDRYAAFSPSGARLTLPGPTGERNTYAALPRDAVLCLADDDRDLMTQLAAVLAVGSRAIWPESERANRLLRALPSAAERSITTGHDWKAAHFDVVLHHGSSDATREILRYLAGRDGPIVTLHAFASGEEEIPLERLVTERVVSVNTAAAGGNATLMTVG
jgi:RHH-type proline utilization regulon transcriptional repressor/proline dehydrogenase/delta 1-pyrroline-5-carboxylate dehydrogenase